MKKWTGVFLFGFLWLSAQNQMVLDAPFICERMMILNYGLKSALNLNSVCPGGLSASAEATPDLDLYPAFPLLSEDDKWTIRAWYLIDLNHPLNRHLVYTYYGQKEPLGAIIYRAIKNRAAGLYRDDSFTQEMTAGELAQLDSVEWYGARYYRIKQDEWYDKRNGTYQSAIIGITLLDAGGTRELGSLYFPELAYQLTQIQYMDGRSFSLKEILEENLFFAPVIDVNRTMHPRNPYEDHQFDDSAPFNTELDALHEIFRMQKGFMLRRAEYGLAEGSVEIGHDFSQLLKGQCRMGMMQGEWKVLSSDSQVIIKVNFVNGKADGPFTMYFDNGRVRQTGSFRDGLREGEWKEYYESGKPKAVWQYRTGWFEGEQVKYYENGQISHRYQYKDGIVHGLSERYYEDGLLLDRGTFTQGIQDGNWEVNIRLKPDVLDHLKHNISTCDLPQEAWADGVLSLHAVILLQRMDDCYQGICPVVRDAVLSDRSPVFH